MNDDRNMDEEELPSLANRESELSAFEKLHRAIELIETAIKERPSLKALQLEPLIRTLAEGLHVLSAKDSELDLRALMLKHQWRVGQRFYVRVTVRNVSDCSFVVLPAQDIPEGVVILGNIRLRDVTPGAPVALDLEITRGVRRVAWRIRALDHERLGP